MGTNTTGKKCLLCEEPIDDCQCYDMPEEPVPDPAVKPTKCEECQVPTGHLYRTQVDSFGRTL